MFVIDVTARPSNDPPAQTLARLAGIVDEELEKLRNAAPDARELDRVKNSIESSFIGNMETVAGKADLMNSYYFATGNPDYFAEDFGRYQSIDPTDVQAAIRRWLPAGKRLELSVVPAPAAAGGAQ